MNTQRNATRQLTSKRVQATLSKAIIAPSGATVLDLVGPGNLYITDTGIRRVIFNVAALRNMETAKEASAAWLQGHKLELSGDIDAAQDHFREALNSMMSFSVLEENASPYREVYQVNAKVEQVPASAKLQEQGIKTVLGINNPRPVAIKASGTSAASLFEVPVLESKTETALERKARLKRETKVTTP